MMKLIFKTAALIAMTTSVLSCSIKEDRTHCPCRLSMDITDCSAYGSRVTLAAWNDRMIFTDTVSVGDYPDTYDVSVPKGYVNAIACSTLDECLMEGTRVIIPEGKQTDRIMARSELVDCRGEVAWDKVTLHKQYASVNLSVLCPEGESYPYSLTVQSDVCGLDLVTLEPVEGPYLCPVKVNPDGNSWTFRLPRQDEMSEPVLQVLHEGEVKDTLPLHRWIEATGYSWDDTDLKDIDITMDYAMTHVNIIISGWDGVAMDIII